MVSSLDSNRLPLLTPGQYLDANGDVLSGGSLTFYITSTSTKSAPYSDQAITTPIANPITLDANGFPTTDDIFLDPDIIYKVVLADSDSVTVRTFDPVYDPITRSVARFKGYAGDPNGNVAGTQATPGSVPADVVYDTSNNALYVCTTTGNAAAAVWTNASGLLTASVKFAGVLSPAAFSTQQDDYEPASLATASVVRLSPGADSDITGIAPGGTPTGRILFLTNISSTYSVTLKDADANSTAANRFIFGRDVKIGPDGYAVILYDATNGRWRIVANASAVGKQAIAVPAAAMWARTTNGAAAVDRELTTGGDIQIKGWGFDTATEEAVQFYVPFPSSWNLGTITARYFWSNTGGGAAETVAWGLSAGAFTDSDPLDTTDLGTEVETSDTWLAQNDLHVSGESTAVTIGNTPAANDLVIAQIARVVGSDDLTGDAELIAVLFFYTTNYGVES